MSDCRNARVRLRRRLENKYSVKRVSVRIKNIEIKNESNVSIVEVKKVPRLVVFIDLNNKKYEFIKDKFTTLKDECKNFVVKVDYFENETSNYKISFLADNIDIGIERVKKYAFVEIMDNVIPELEKIYQEIILAEN